MNAGEILWFEHQKVGIWDITEDGTVYRYKERADNPLGWVDIPPKRLDGTVTSRGYAQIGFDYRGKHYTCVIHRLVYARHVGYIPFGYEVDHIDFNPLNNHVSNLQAVTPAENKARSEHHRLAALPKGSEHWNHKLNPDKVKEIRRLYRDGIPVHLISEQFGIAIRTTYCVLEKRSWAHVPDDESERDAS